MRRRRGLSELKPHVRVGLVTLVLVASGVAVLVVSLTALSRVDDHVGALRTRVEPARSELLAVERGLARSQVIFINLMSEQDRVQRVLDIQSIREQLSLNDEAWRRFRQVALGLPGEADLVRRFEELQAELNRLEGPVGLLLIGPDDPTGMWTDANVQRLRQVQGELMDVTQQLDRDLYAPLVTDEVQSADDAGRSGTRNVWIAFAVVMALSLPLALMAYTSARRNERAALADHARRTEDARRSRLEAQLNRAFELAGSEQAAFRIVEQALLENLPGRPVELLVADSSVAHFRQVLSTDAVHHGPGCSVVAPADCPAAHRGDTLVFSRSTDLDACPHLRDRSSDAVAAVCQPVSIAGKSIGVLHTTFADGLPADDAPLVNLDLIARRAGERIGMLRAFAETESQARTDPLTGLLNRRSLENAVRRLVHEGGRYCVAYGDLDHFKALNDTHGHDMGDRALRTFSRVVRDSIRPNDLACRYGGEEFVLILPDCEVDEAVTVVERLRAALADAMTSGRVPPFTVSFGVASSIQADSFERVVALADQALLAAKAAGRDRVLVAGGVGPAALPAGPAAPA